MPLFACLVFRGARWGACGDANPSSPVALPSARPGERQASKHAKGASGRGYGVMSGEGPSASGGRRALVLALLLGAPVEAACSRPSLPDPQAAIRAYAEAVERGDANRLYQLMTRASQERYGRAGAERMLREAHEELRGPAASLLTSVPQPRITASVRFVDGEEAMLLMEDGRLGIRSVDALPYGARTPEEALAGLRAALARRSYPALVRILSSETRATLESDMRTLVEGLQEPRTLDVKVRDNEAEVEVPGGHSVKLKREAGVWKIRDFD